jgi:hypothetical protein
MTFELFFSNILCGENVNKQNSVKNKFKIDPGFFRMFISQHIIIL